MGQGEFLNGAGGSGLILPNGAVDKVRGSGGRVSKEGKCSESSLSILVTPEAYNEGRGVMGTRSDQLLEGGTYLARVVPGAAMLLGLAQS